MEHISDLVNVNKCGIGVAVLCLNGKALAGACPDKNIYHLCNNWQDTISDASSADWGRGQRTTVTILTCIFTVIPGLFLPMSCMLKHLCLCPLGKYMLLFKLYIYLGENQAEDRENDLPKLRCLSIRAQEWCFPTWPM